VNRKENKSDKAEEMNQEADSRDISNEAACGWQWHRQADWAQSVRERISAASVNSTVPRRANQPGHGARSGGGGGGEIKSTTDQQDSDRHGGGEVAVVDRVKPTTTSPPAAN